MKTLMRTIGILSLLFALCTVISCEKDDDLKPDKPDKPDKTEQLFALSTRVVTPNEDAASSNNEITNGIIIGTKAEMEAYIDRATKAGEEAEGDNPPEPQSLSLLGHNLSVYGTVNPVGPVVENDCWNYYNRNFSYYYYQTLEIVNQVCVPLAITWTCPFNNRTYLGAMVEPSEDCFNDPTVGDDEVLYKHFKLAIYPFGVDDDGPEVEAFIKNLAEF